MKHTSLSTRQMRKSLWGRKIDHKSSFIDDPFFFQEEKWW